MKRARIWMDIIEGWVINNMKTAKHRILVVMYEDLKSNEESQLQRMVNFLNTGSKFDEEVEDDPTITRPSRNFTASFHRKHSSTEEPFEPYTSQQKAHVLDIITRTQKRLERNDLTSILSVGRYLESQEKHNSERAVIGKEH